MVRVMLVLVAAAVAMAARLRGSVDAVASPGLWEKEQVFGVGDAFHVELETDEATYVALVLELGQRAVAIPFQYHDNKYTVNLKVNAPDFRRYIARPGSYSARIVTGGPDQDPFTWKVGRIVFKIPEPQQSRSQFAPKTEIWPLPYHPEDRPGAIAATVFTALCVAPLLAFCAYLCTSGLPLALPGSISTLLPMFLFQCSLFSLLALLFLYWLRLTLFTTLQYGAVLSLITLASGHRALAQLHQSRHLKLKGE